MTSVHDVLLHQFFTHIAKSRYTPFSTKHNTQPVTSSEVIYPNHFNKTANWFFEEIMLEASSIAI